MKKLKKADILYNLENLASYCDLREYLMGRIIRIEKTPTERRMRELSALRQLVQILDVSAEVANGNGIDVNDDDLYSLLS